MGSPALIKEGKQRTSYSTASFQSDFIVNYGVNSLRVKVIS